MGRDLLANDVRVMNRLCVRKTCKLVGTTLFVVSPTTLLGISRLTGTLS